MKNGDNEGGSSLERLNALIGSVLDEHGLDRRTVYVAARAVEPDGGRVVVESSDPIVAEEISNRTGGTGAGRADVEVVALPRGEGLPELFSVSGSVADIRGEPSHTSELLTQAMSSEFLEPIKSQGDWLLVRVEDGYVGWVRNWSVKPCTRSDRERFLQRASFRVADNMIRILETPSQGSLAVSEALAGTLVAAEPAGRRGWRRVELADGRTGFARSGSLQRLPGRRRISRRELARTGLRFVGVPYLWGGTTPKGFDCSGLVQRIYRMNWIALPRDSDMQAGIGRLKPSRRLEELSTGDLLFFGSREGEVTHVGMYLSDSLFLHAHGRVRVGSLDPQNPLFEPGLYEKWLLTRDPLCR